MEELAQSVGNERMPGEFDWDAATDVDLNTNDSGPLCSNPALGHEEALSLLFQKIVQLPLGRKKVLAMHYHEHIPLSEIAARMGAAESLICQIDAQTIALAQLSLEGVETRQREFFTRVEPGFFASANRYIREEINKDSGYANVVPRRAKIKK